MHTHTHIYIHVCVYIYICICTSVFVWKIRCQTSRVLNCKVTFSERTVGIHAFSQFLLSPSLCFPAPRPAQFRCRWCSWPSSNRAGGAPYRVTYRFTDCSCCCGKVQQNAETPLAQKVMKAGDSANLRRRLQVHPCITDSTINIINFVLSNWSFQMYFLWPGDHLVGAFTVLAQRREFLADSFPLTLQAGGRHTAACSNLHFLKMSWPQCIFSTCCLRRWTRLAKIDRENPQLVS